MIKINFPTVENKNHWNTVTVKELIKALQSLPEDATVITEGCDCYGSAVALEYTESDNEVLICRNPSHE